MKRSYKSYLQKTKTEKERYEVFLSDLLRWAGVYFSYGFVRQVGGRRVRDLSPSEQLRLLRRQTMQLLQPLPREGKTSKKKNLKNYLAEIHTLEVRPIHRNVAGSRFVEIPFDRQLPVSFRTKLTKRGHNLFLPKMRRISVRQLNHRNDNRKVCPIRKNKCFLWPYRTFYLSLHQ